MVKSHSKSSRGKSEIGKRIDRIIDSGLTKYLKSEGFKKNGRYYYRESTGRIEVLNIQADKYNQGNEGGFTVNVGVYYPAIEDIVGGLPVNGLPKVYNCTVWERIGIISERRKDFWWSLDNDTDDDEVAESLSSTVKMYCLPWLNEMSNLQTLKESLPEHMAFRAAAIALYQGNKQEAKEYLDRYKEVRPNSKEELEAWGSKHGIA